MQNLNVRSSKLAAAPKCKAEADAMCVLVPAAGAPTTGTCRCVCLCDGAAMHARPDCSIKLAAAPRCEAEADAMCVLVSAASTPTKAPAGVFALRRSRHEHSAPGGASLRLLRGARRRQQQGLKVRARPCSKRREIGLKCCSAGRAVCKLCVQRWP